MSEESVRKEVISRVFDIALKIRVHREWQKNNAAFPLKYSERDMLTLELIEQFPGITEKSLGIILGLAPSSVSLITTRLVEEGLINKNSRNILDRREKPLRLSDKKGKSVLTKIKHSSAERYEYMFSRFSSEQLEAFKPLLDTIEETVSKRVNQDVFNR